MNSEESPGDATLRVLSISETEEPRAPQQQCTASRRGREKGTGWDRTSPTQRDELKGVDDTTGAGRQSADAHRAKEARISTTTAKVMILRGLADHRHRHLPDVIIPMPVHHRNGSEVHRRQPALAN